MRCCPHFLSAGACIALVDSRQKLIERAYAALYAYKASREPVAGVTWMALPIL